MKLNLGLDKKESSATNDTSSLSIPLPSTEEESPTIEPTINRNAFIYESGGLALPGRGKKIIILPSQSHSFDQNVAFLRIY